MAETVNKSVSDAERQRRELDQIVPSLRRPGARGVVYGGRFMLAYLVLVLVFGGLTALATYLIVQREPERWSTFEPRGERLARAASIANHVAPKYRANGRQIAVVEAQPPFVDDRVISMIAIARERIGPVGGGFQSMEPADRTLFYVFCGLGENCAITGFTGRHLALVQRESLELALYTFKYMEGIDAVVGLLTVAPGQLAAVYLRRRALVNQLEKPLAASLEDAPPYTPTDNPDRETVASLTEHRVFPAYFQPAPNGGVALRLGGPPPENTQQQGRGATQNP